MSIHEDYILKLTKYLHKNHPNCILVQTKQNIDPHVEDKRPAITHKGKPSHDLWSHWKKVGMLNCDKGIMMILRSDLIIIDIDDQNDVDMVEKQFPEFLNTSIQKTRKGKHYFFKRSEHCESNKIYDSARSLYMNGRELAIDIKTKTKNGTGGLITLFPAPNKKWISPIYEFESLPMISDAFIDFILQNNSHMSKNVKSNGDRVSSDDPYTLIQTIELEPLIDMLDDSRAERYSDWLNLGICIYNVTKKSYQGFEMWDNFSQKCSYKYSYMTCREKWEGMRPGDMTIATLHFWAKNDNPQRYAEYIQHNVKSSINDCDGSHSSIARVAYTMLKGRHVKDSTWFYFDDVLWKTDHETAKLRLKLTYKVCQEFYRHAKVYENQAKEEEAVDPEKAEQWSKIAKTIKSTGQSIKNNTVKTHVVRELVDLMIDPEFINNLDVNPNFIAFTNGVWLLKEKQFRPLLPEDMVSKSVGYDFKAERNQTISEIIYKYWETMHPDEDQRMYMIQSFARQLYGDACMNKFHIHSGYRADAQNGKSKFFEILCASLGDYAKKFQVQHLTQKKRIEVGKATPDLEEWKGTRILFCEEPHRDDILNSGVLKDYTGGGEMIYRPLYGGTHRFKPMFKMHLLCNETPRIEGDDRGIQRRIHKIDYISRFVEPHKVNIRRHHYPIDDKLIYKMIHNEHYKMEFLHILFDHYDHDFAFNDLPQCVKKSTENYMEENDSMAEFFNTYTREKEGAFFTLKAMNNLYKTTTYYDGLGKPLKVNDLVKHFTTYREHKRINNIKYVNVIENFELVPVLDLVPDLGHTANDVEIDNNPNNEPQTQNTVTVIEPTNSDDERNDVNRIENQTLDHFTPPPPIHDTRQSNDTLDDTLDDICDQDNNMDSEAEQPFEDKNDQQHPHHFGPPFF